MTHLFRPDSKLLLVSVTLVTAMFAGPAFSVHAAGSVWGGSAEHAPLPPETRIDRLVVSKSGRTMTAWFRGRKIRAYRVGLGQNPVGPKEAEGDKKTPEGLYKVVEKASSAQYHKRLVISYPNAADRKNAAAKGLKPGSGISIHGLGVYAGKYGGTHWQRNWTNGGVAVTNAEIDELFTHMDIGARVEIVP